MSYWRQWGCAISPGGPRGSGEPRQGASTVCGKHLTPVSEDGLVSPHSTVRGEMWEDTPSSQGTQSNRVSDLRNQANAPRAGAEVLSVGSPRLGAVEVVPGGPSVGSTGPQVL